MSYEAKYWRAGDETDLERIIDEQVGLALKEYICDTGRVMIEWWDRPEPEVVFSTGDTVEFEKGVLLFELLVEEVGMYRPGGDDRDDLFFDPKGDRKVILLQALLRTYLDWKKGGVHVPKPDEETGDTPEGDQ